MCGWCGVVLAVVSGAAVGCGNVRVVVVCCGSAVDVVAVAVCVVVVGVVVVAGVLVLLSWLFVLLVCG